MEDTATVEQKILKAAREVFITKGFDATRMHDIAEYAGINLNLLNYYYRNKQCLFDSVFEKAFISFIPNVVDILISSKSFKEKIEDIVDGYFNIINKHPHFADFLFNELKRNPDRLVDNLKRMGLDIDKIDEVLDEEAEKGKIKKIRTDHLLCTVLSLVFMPAIAGPLIKNLLCKNDQEAYLRFTEERRQVIKDVIVEYVEL